MGVPFFEIKNLSLRHDVITFSSNYQLYGSISQRVMNALKMFSSDVQIYSIDEAFLLFPDGMSEETVIEVCEEMRAAIKRWMGMPISVGIGPTKTLAKAANRLAKKSVRGVVSLSRAEERERFLKDFPVGDVWGIGHRLQMHLKGMGLYTAWDFLQAEPTLIRKKFGVVGERMLWELRGVGCLPLVEEYAPKQSICSSRSFGVTLRELGPMQEAIATHAATVCEKLRKQNSSAEAISVFAESLVDPQTGSRKHYAATAVLALPTNDTPTMIAAAKDLLATLFSPQQRYKKCGVIVMGIQDERSIAPDLFIPCPDPKRRRLAGIIDGINTRFGKETLFYASMGTDPIWKMKSERRSRRYTTSWEELVLVH